MLIWPRHHHIQAMKELMYRSQIEEDLRKRICWLFLGDKSQPQGFERTEQMSKTVAGPQWSRAARWW